MLEIKGIGVVNATPLTADNKVNEKEYHMRRTTSDRTLEKNYIQKWRFLIQDYELVKAKKHPRFKFVSDFYNHHGTSRQTFIKYYNRFKQSGNDIDLLPRKRGPKWKSRRPLPVIEHKVIQERRKGINRYEINDHLVSSSGYLDVDHQDQEYKK